MNSMNNLMIAGDAGNRLLQSLDAYLSAWARSNAVKSEVADLIRSLLEGAAVLSGRISAGRLLVDLSGSFNLEIESEGHEPIEVASHRLFSALLLEAGAGQILSKTIVDPIINDFGGKFAVALDPLEGLDNVGSGAPLGTLFSVVPIATPHPFLQAGRHQVAAGYISYGKSIDLGVSLGDGMIMATMEPSSGRFFVTAEHVRLPSKASHVAFDAANYRRLPPFVQTYIADCLDGMDGPRDRDFNVGWLGTVVGELHRIMNDGGIFFSIRDSRCDPDGGVMSHVCTANPIAFLCRSAGGTATNGTHEILDKAPGGLHEATSLIFGSTEEVGLFCEYHKDG